MKKTSLLLAAVSLFVAASLYAQSAQTRFDNGIRLYNQSNYDAAIQEFTEAIRLDPNNARAYAYRGISYSNKNDYDRAIADHTQTIRLLPNDAMVYYNRGSVYYQKKDYDYAITDLTQAIKLNPNNADAYDYRGLSYYNKRDYDRAIADLTQAIKLTPNNALLYNNRGYVYKEKKDYDRAIADFEAALKLNPDFTAAKSNLADARQAQQQQNTPQQAQGGTRTPAPAPAKKTAPENPYLVTIDTEYNVVNSIDTGTAYLNKQFVNWGDLTPIIMTFVNNDGSVSICSVNTGTRETYIYEYAKDLKYTKTMRFQNEYNKFGAFTKDDKGNYYIFSARDVGENEKNVNSMALVKYDRSGKMLNTYTLNAYASNSFNGIKKPFDVGSCRMEISGNMLCVYLAREKFASARDGLNHQASYGFILDKESFRRIDVGQVSNDGIVLGGLRMPYVSHSFNQFILPIDGGFVFVDQGDGYPRGFAFEKMQNGQIKKITSFAFKQGSTYQNTFAQLGGLAKTPRGYIFAGTYERNTIVSDLHNDSRNLFILTFDNNLTACSQPVWITNYNNKDTDNAASPKITELDAGHYLLMWERMSKNRHEATYAVVIDENGKLLTPIEQLGSIRLNINDPLRFNRTTKSVYWAVNGGNRTINIYAYNLEHLIKINTSGKKGK